MEIVEHGGKIYECGDCGCKFKITSKDDIKRYDSVLDPGGFFGILPLIRDCDTVRCPECGHKIVIKWY